MKVVHKNGGLAVGAVVVTGAVLVALALVAIGQAGTNSGNLDPGKQDVLDRLQATRDAAIQFAEEHPGEIPTRNPTTMPTIQPTSWSVGIVDSGQAPISGMGYAGVNSWSWDLDGDHVVVYAGAEGAETRNPGRGVLIVLVSAMDLSSVPEKSGSYLAPLGVGSLHIMSFQGSILTVHATTGEAFYFDAESRAFTDASGNPVATGTPTPTPIPTPVPSPTAASSIGAGG